MDKSVASYSNAVYNDSSRGRKRTELHHEEVEVDYGNKFSNRKDSDRVYNTVKKESHHFQKDSRSAPSDRSTFEAESNRYTNQGRNRESYQHNKVNNAEPFSRREDKFSRDSYGYAYDDNYVSSSAQRGPNTNRRMTEDFNPRHYGQPRRSNQSSYNWNREREPPHFDSYYEDDNSRQERYPRVQRHKSYEAEYNTRYEFDNNRRDYGPLPTMEFRRRNQDGGGRWGFACKIYILSCALEVDHFQHNFV